MPAYKHVYIGKYIYINAHLYLFVCSYTYIHTYVHTYIYTQIYTETYVRTFVQGTCINPSPQTYAQTDRRTKNKDTWSRKEAGRWRRRGQGRRRPEASCPPPDFQNGDPIPAAPNKPGEAAAADRSLGSEWTGISDRPRGGGGCQSFGCRLSACLIGWLSVSMSISMFVCLFLSLRLAAGQSVS